MQTISEMERRPMTTTLDMPGLDGYNPAGYLAGLGTLAIAEDNKIEAKLSWNDDGGNPHAVLTSDLGLPEFVEAAKTTFAKWEESPETDPACKDNIKYATDARAAIREHIEDCLTTDTRGLFTASYMMEYCLNGTGTNAKTSDLDFSPGKNSFLKNLRIAMNIAREDDKHLISAIEGTCAYDTKMPVSNWEPRHFSTHAMGAMSPSAENSGGKNSNPGLEALARVGMSMLPAVFSRSLNSPGVFIEDGKTYFIWGLWSHPMSYSAVKTLAGCVSPESITNGWGVFQVVKSEIINAGTKTPRNFSNSVVVSELEAKAA